MLSAEIFKNQSVIKVQIDAFINFIIYRKKMFAFLANSI